MIADGLYSRALQLPETQGDLDRSFTVVMEGLAICEAVELGDLAVLWFAQISRLIGSIQAGEWVAALDLRETLAAMNGAILRLIAH